MAAATGGAPDPIDASSWWDVSSVGAGMFYSPWTKRGTEPGPDVGSIMTLDILSRLDTL
jgi:hypothetical protein